MYHTLHMRCCRPDLVIDISLSVGLSCKGLKSAKSAWNSYDTQKQVKPLWKVKGPEQYTSWNARAYVCVHMYIFVCVCICTVILRANANDWRIRAGVVLDLFSNFWMGKILRFTIGEPLMHVRALSFSLSFSLLSSPLSPLFLLRFLLQSLSLFLFLSRWTLCGRGGVLWCVENFLFLSLLSPSSPLLPLALTPPCVDPNALPCVDSKRLCAPATGLHVTFWIDRRRRVGIYTRVLPRFFQRAAPHTPHTNTTQRQPQRQRHTTNQPAALFDSTWENPPGPDTGRIALMVVHGRFSVGEVICLVTLFNDRDLSLLNHVKYDSYLITSQRDRSRTHP